MPVDSLADFIVYIAPGFLATEVYKSYFPGKERSTFAQLAMSIVWASIIVVAVRLIDDNLLRGALHSSTTTPLAETKFIASLLLFGALFGWMAAKQLEARISLGHKYEFLAWLAPVSDSVWKFVNDRDVEDWAVVTLVDGTKYLGWISNYRFDPDESDQDFLLSRARRVDDRLAEAYVVDGIGVYLNTRDIVSIEFVGGKSLPHDTTS